MIRRDKRKKRARTELEVREGEEKRKAGRDMDMRRKGDRGRKKEEEIPRRINKARRCKV